MRSRKKFSDYKNPATMCKCPFPFRPIALLTQHKLNRKAATISSTLTSLRKQQADLVAQFQSRSSSSTPQPSITKPNDPSLAADFAHAQSSTSAAAPAATKKAVRFSSPDQDLEAQRSTLFNQPYTDIPDDDTAGYRDQADQMDNTQIHAYHQRILDEQDAQLDSLSHSIGRQRELSMQIGNELDEQVLMLDESERAADRQASALDRARRQVGRIVRGDNGDNGRHMAIIVILIIILVLLIVILK